MGHMVLGPSELLTVPVTFTRYTMILDGVAEKLAVRFNAGTASPITDVDIPLHPSSAAGATFRIGIFSDSSDSPGTQLGGWANFIAPTADGWTGLLTLSANTGTLTVGTFYWIVIEYVSGTIGASDYIQLRYFDGSSSSYNRMRHYNGTNWTTTSAVNFPAMFVFQHADLSYSGQFPWTVAIANSVSASDIFVNAGANQVQGIKFRVGSKSFIRGVFFSLSKSGAPNDLIITVYEGDTSKYSVTLPASTVISAVNTTITFPSPVILAADTDIYIVLSQTGTSNTNDYDSRIWGINGTYIDTILPPDYRFVHGVLGTPSGLTVSTTEIPAMFPIIHDLAADFDCAAAGGGASGPWGMIR